MSRSDKHRRSSLIDYESLFQLSDKKNSKNLDENGNNISIAFDDGNIKMDIDSEDIILKPVPFEFNPIPPSSINTEQDYLTATIQFNRNVSKYLQTLMDKQQICDLTQIFVPGTLRIISKREKKSASEAVIGMGKLIVQDVYRHGIDQKFFTDAKYEGFTNIVMKIFLTPTKDTFDNSLDIEATLYKNVTSRLITAGHTPHIINYLATITCELDKLKLVLHNPDDARIIILNQLQYQGKSNWKCIDLHSIGTVQLSLLILEHGGGQTLKQRLRLKSLSSLEDLIHVFFQILWTFMCFEKLGLRHNDPHFDNFFLNELEDGPYEFCYELPNNWKIRMKTKWLVKLFDFDRGTIYHPLMQRNMKLDLAWSCGVCLNKLEAPKNEIPDIGKKYGSNACNSENAAFDVHGIMIYFLTKIDDPLNLNYVKIHNWIFDQMPLEIYEYHMNELEKHKFNSIHPQLAYDHYVQQLVAIKNLHIKTPTEYLYSLLTTFATIDNKMIFSWAEPSQTLLTLSTLWNVNILREYPWMHPTLPFESNQILYHAPTHELSKTIATRVSILKIKVKEDVKLKKKKEFLPNYSIPEREYLINYQLEKLSDLPGRENISFLRAEAELNVDLTIIPRMDLRTGQINSQIQNLITQWIIEMEALKQTAWKWNYDIDRQELFTWYINQLKTDNPKITISIDLQIGIAKASIIIACPLFHGSPMNFRNRILLQIGQVACNIYHDMFKRSHLSTKITNITIPHLYFTN